MNRKVFAGVAMAGALTLLTSVASFAHEGDQTDALMTQAQTLADTASAGIDKCATDQLASFAALSKPANVSTEAWDRALETAGNKVEALQESGTNRVEAALNSFEGQVENVDEEGAQLPTLAGLTAELTQLQNDFCNQIKAVSVKTPPASVTPPTTENDTERDTETESEHHDSTVAEHSSSND